MSEIENVIRGDSHTINLTISDNGTPVDLVGYTVFFTVNSSKEPDSDATASVQKTVTTGNSSGEVTIAITPQKQQSLLLTIGKQSSIETTITQRADTITVVEQVVNL